MSLMENGGRADDVDLSSLPSSMVNDNDCTDLFHESLSGIKTLEHAPPSEPMHSPWFGMVDSSQSEMPPPVSASNQDVTPGAFAIVPSFRNTEARQTFRSPIRPHDLTRQITYEESTHECGMTNCRGAHTEAHDSSRTAAESGLYTAEVQRVQDGNQEGTVIVADVQYVGMKWFQRRWISLGSFLFATFLVGAVVVIVVLFLRSPAAASSSALMSPTTITTPLPTLAPSFQPEVDPEDQLVILLDAMESVNISTMFFPSSASFFTPNLVANTTRLPSIRAMAWVLNMDPRDSLPDNPWLIFRYALASIYYSFRGENWTNSENWLTGEHACKWHGVICDRSQANYVFELYLSNNNVVGTIPIQISLLSDLRSLILTGNEVTGTIPSVRLGNMRNLSLLYLNENQLSGDLSALSTLNANNALSTLVIQENNITGRWPKNFCPTSGGGPVFTEFSLDCYDETRCLCCKGSNCF